MSKEDERQRFAETIALENIARIVEMLTSFTEVPLTLLDENADVVFQSKIKNDQAYQPDYKAIISRVVKFRALLVEDDEKGYSAITYPIWVHEDFVGALLISPIFTKDQEKIYQLMLLVGTFINEITRISFQVADTVIHGLMLQDELMLLHKFMRKLGGQTEVREVANDILTDVVETLEPKCACILLLNEEKTKFTTIVCHNPNCQMFNDVTVDGGGIISKVIQSREGMIINKLKKEDLMCMPVNKLLVVPLRVEDEVIGIICVRDKESGEDFYAGDHEFVSTLAGPASVAINDVKLNEELVVRTKEAWQEISFRAAHKMGNSLFGVRGNVEWLQGVFNEKPLNENELSEAIQDVARSLSEANSIIREFKGYIHPDELQLELADVNLLLGRAISEIRRAAGEEVTIKEEFTDTLPQIELDVTKLKQSVKELLENASRFMNYKGQITVRSYIAQESDFIAIEVEDTGKGVPEENKEKIFHPFFSTSGTGTGLGLPIVQTYVEKHGGKIAEVGEYGKGAKFLILLPIHHKVQAETHLE